MFRYKHSLGPKLTTQWQGAGMTIGTLFTLFVVPAVYVLIAKDHRAVKKAVRRRRQTFTNSASMSGVVCLGTHTFSM